MARKFLYIIAIAVVLVLAGAIALSFWSAELTRLALVPQGQFTRQEPLAPSVYQDPAMWIARPGIGDADPSRWLPDGFTPEAAPPSTTAIFFIHPTSYMIRGEWNAPLDDAASRSLAELFVRAMASPFNRSVAIWAPRYRQAAVGAFMTEKPDARMAIEAAYEDVEQAFDYFLSSIGRDTPIVLAGHSQGSLHLIRLLNERVAGTPLADRIVAAYPIGWPISIRNDLPHIGLPACASPAQPGCVASWSSYAEPAEPEPMLEAYGRSTGLNGEPQGETAILCTNPLTGRTGGAAPASLNLGTLVPEEGLQSGRLVAAAVPARCDERGLLLIGEPPEMGSAVLPGNNYHVYDIPLFWANLRVDFARREAAFRAQSEQAQ